MLYIAVGDGSKRDDVRRLAQNPFLLNGKVLRIDVNNRSQGLGYAIPEDNPFVKEGMRGEIWAMGLRNPWGIDYDRKTGIFGSLSLMSARTFVKKSITSKKVLTTVGVFARPTKSFRSVKMPPRKVLTLRNRLQYMGVLKGVSITGGVVYYGKKHSKLKGHFLYGDWGTGHVWAASHDVKKNKSADRMIFRNNEQGSRKDFVFKPSAFLSAGDGEVLCLSWNGGIFEMTSP